MPCCGGNQSDEQTSHADLCEKREDNENPNFLWQPTLKNAKKIAYVRQLECRYEKLQLAYFDLSVQLARAQGCLRQIVRADSCERAHLINEVKSKGLNNCHCHACPTLEQQNAEMGTLQRKQQLLIANLRQKLCSFQQATEDLDKKEQRQEEKESQDSLISGCFKSCRASKSKETSSIKITKYETEATSTSQNIKPDKVKKFNKEKNNTKTSAKISAPSKKEVAKKSKDEVAWKSKVSSAESFNKKTSANTILNKKSNQDIAAKPTALSSATLTSGQSIISTRSATFKELKAKYQQNQDNKK